MIRIKVFYNINFPFPKIDVKWHQSATFLNFPPKYPDFGSRSSATINEYATPYVTLHAFPKVKKPSIFTYRKARHRQIISGLRQEREGMWLHALTFLASVVHHMGFIQIRFSTAATVLWVSEKSLPVWVVNKLYINYCFDQVAWRYKYYSLFCFNCLVTGSRLVTPLWWEGGVLHAHWWTG